MPSECFRYIFPNVLRITIARSCSLAEQSYSKSRVLLLREMHSIPIYSFKLWWKNHKPYGHNNCNNHKKEYLDIKLKVSKKTKYNNLKWKLDILKRTKEKNIPPQRICRYHISPTKGRTIIFLLAETLGASDTRS